MSSLLLRNWILYPKLYIRKYPNNFKINTLVPELNYLTYRNKATIDYSSLPVLNEDDLEEKFVRGSGPGGQAVNKTSNCVMLRHVPTGIIVKCHASRSMNENRKEARRLLVSKLDLHLNGENSIENQLRRTATKKMIETSRRQKLLEELKKKWKLREGIFRDSQS